MKTKLLKKIRKIGKSQINIYSFTKKDDINIGMSFGCDSDLYCNLFEIGDTEDDINNKAIRVYYDNNKDCIREKYTKYSIKNKK